MASRTSYCRGILVFGFLIDRERHCPDECDTSKGSQGTYKNAIKST